MKAALLIALAGCGLQGGERAMNHECPPGETCSPLTPDGLVFTGQSIHDGQVFVPQDNHPTAVGGTQDFEITLPDGQRLDLPFSAEVGGPAVALVGQTGSTVTVRGLADAYGELKIRDSDGLLMDEAQVQAVPVVSPSITPATWESYGAATYVVAPELGTLAVRIGAVDSSMKLELLDAQGGTLDSQLVAWDEIAVPPGLVTVRVTAGDQAAAELSVNVVTGADAMALDAPNPASIAPGGSATLCFKATNAGRSVFGLRWQFAVDGAASAPGFMPNCVGFSTTKTSGAVTVTATAGGASTSVSLPVSPG